VASACIAENKMDLNFDIFMILVEAMLKSLCNVYNILIENK